MAVVKPPAPLPPSVLNAPINLKSAISPPGKTPPPSNPPPQQATLTSFNPLNPLDWLKGILGFMGSGTAKDALERFGLIVFGGALILVGIIMLTGKAAITLAFPETKAAAPVRRTEAFRRSEIHHYTHKDGAVTETVEE